MKVDGDARRAQLYTDLKAVTRDVLEATDDEYAQSQSTDRPIPENIYRGARREREANTGGSKALPFPSQEVAQARKRPTVDL